MVETSYLLPKSKIFSSHRKKSFHYLRSCCVPFKGAILVLVWSALLHSAGFYVNLTLSSHEITHTIEFTRISMACVQVAMIVTLLLYPLAGLLAETLFTRLKFMITATVIAMIGLLLVIISSILDLSQWYSGYNVILSLEVIGFIVRHIGLGMFEANAIQFGVDQLQFASNEELSKFVHWYFWSVYAVQFIIALYVIENITPHFIKNISPHYYLVSDQYVLLIMSVFSLICTTVALGLVIYFMFHRHLLIEPTSTSNPVTLIYKVLNYARHHSQPVRRSAFTYGDPPPSRLDMTKERYGGPFTTEQVEDVKSFWKILVLLSSLFGLSLPMNIFINLGMVQMDLSHTINQESIGIGGKFYSGISVVTYNQNIYYPVILLCIPIYMCILRPCLSYWKCLRSISMIKKMAVGLIMICITLIITAISSALMYQGYDGEQCITWNVSFDHRDLNWTSIESDITLVALPIAQVFYGLGFTLGFLTALEFILAQAPRTMQGLLIGLWYAYQSLGLIVFLTIALTQDAINCHYWPYIIITVLSFVSLCLYAIVSYRYDYRQRQELTNINYRTIIEEYTDRHLQRARQEEMEIETSVDIIITENN